MANCRFLSPLCNRLDHHRCHCHPRRIIVKRNYWVVYCWMIASQRDDDDIIKMAVIIITTIIIIMLNKIIPPSGIDSQSGGIFRNFIIPSCMLLSGMNSWSHLHYHRAMVQIPAGPDARLPLHMAAASSACQESLLRHLIQLHP